MLPLFDVILLDCHIVGHPASHDARMNEHMDCAVYAVLAGFISLAQAEITMSATVPTKEIDCVLYFRCFTQDSDFDP